MDVLFKDMCSDAEIYERAFQMHFKKKHEPYLRALAEEAGTQAQGMELLSKYNITPRSTIIYDQSQQESDEGEDDN